MANFVETKIKAGLSSRVEALTLIPALDVSWPGIAFDPTSAGYLKVSHVPSSTEHLFLRDTDENRYSGLLLLDLFWPQDRGEIEATEKAGEIIDHFKLGTVIKYGGITIRIERPPSISSAFEVAPFFQVPVTITYITDAPQP